uniref:Hemolysin activation/secretion protein n=1 Tax=Candidatus Kentrum sp. DK TaxID=2126562 RepID=A0A450SAX8_9GAMM|nr:MAG: Hemolysin activation/secretion protein [Candidatus Kentron sp. DK]
MAHDTKVTRFGGSLAFALLLYGPASLAAPPDAGSLLRQQEQLERLPARQFPEAEASVPERAMPTPEEGMTIRVREIRFSGAMTLAPEGELRAVVGDAVGQDLDFNGLKRLADRITGYLKGKGYLLARAYLPPQDVSEGIVEFALVEGKLEEGGGWYISPDEGTRVDPALLAAIAQAGTPPGGVPKETDLERVLLLMNDLPGVRASARIEPGEQTGTSRIVVNVAREPFLQSNLQANNFGSYNTGSETLNARFDLNNPLRMGDHVGVLATASEGVRFIRMGYDVPIGVRGMRASANYTDMRYEVREGTGRTVGLEGKSGIIQLGLRYPVIRSRAVNLAAGLDLGRKNIQDDSDAGILRDKRVKYLALGLDGSTLDGWGGGGINSARVALTAGDLDLSHAPADETADQGSLRTQGTYRVLRGNISRLQRLPENFSVLGRVSAQWGSKNLDSSEEFIMGGPAGVRAYPVGEAQGDEGWLANLDLRYDVPGGTPWGRLQVSTFVDAGRIRMHDNPGDTAIATATGNNRYSLYGWGIGVGLSKPKSHSVRLSWASKIGGNDGRDTDGNDADGKDNRNRFWLQAAYQF